MALLPRLEVNFDRLRADIEALAEIGRERDQGIYRMAFSPGDMAGRSWFQDRIEEAGLGLHIDGAANIHARLNWNEEVPSIMSGSHLDTVPGGGHLDGALGVVVALECLRSLSEQNLELHYPVEAVAFTDEEGRFGEMIGSQAICGQLTPEHLHNTNNQVGQSLFDAMAGVGLDARRVLEARRRPGSIRAFVELHIEQGPVLDLAGKSIGVVDAIAGLFKWQVRLRGQANHAGTTPMSMRRDAFQGLAEFSGEINRIIEEHGGPRSVATVGRVQLHPGAVNVVPGRVDFSLEVRDTDPATLKNLAQAFRIALSAIARRRDLMFEFDVIGELAPVHCDRGIVDTIEQICEQMKLDALRMHSGAAHDTQTMSSITRAAMIFVPSAEGRSHSPAEWTAWEDIQAGANLTLNTLYRLAAEPQ